VEEEELELQVDFCRIRLREVETVEEEELEMAEEDIQEEKKEEQTEPEQEPDLPFAVEMASFMALDFDLRDTNGMRPARNPASNPIEVAERKRATPAMRGRIVWLADELGYRTTRSKKYKLAITEAACRAVFYDCGCSVAYKEIDGWILVR